MLPNINTVWRATPRFLSCFFTFGQVFLKSCLNVCFLFLLHNKISAAQTLPPKNKTTQQAAYNLTITIIHISGILTTPPKIREWTQCGDFCAHAKTHPRFSKVLQILKILRAAQNDILSLYQCYLPTSQNSDIIECTGTFL